MGGASICGADAEMLEDIRDYDAAVAALEDGEELVPAEILKTIATILADDVDELI